ncbi:MAG: tRNA (guanosine(37)-N1)-methyltransferase TrmD [Anaerolineae bacterium]|nr:tRNA (guanosine(37)-N1)-methyltransferase TrmD [Anaerolineae bacterium]
MQIDVLTLFPEMFAPLHLSMMWKAQDRQLLTLALHDLRQYTQDRHRTADDVPYGGGGGMLLKADVVVPAVEAVRGDSDCPVILLAPQGRVLHHGLAVALSRLPRLILLCGHYEGLDERVRELVVTDEISLGDYVLTGGELAAMVLIDAVVRQIPGVLGAAEGAARESHADGLLEGPHYTRPPVYRGLAVPPILLQGHHRQIDTWRRQEALRRTWRSRPDLLRTAPLSEEDAYFLAELARQDALNR